MNVTEIYERRSDLCWEILDDLPDWFGIPEANAAFAKTSSALPMFAAHLGGQLAGIVSLKRHTAFALELYLLGVKRRLHRQGIGRSLVEAAANFGKANGAAFLTVKTLAASYPDPRYAATRGFYEAVGFVPIEVFPTLWNPRNPCLLMIKTLS